MSANFSEAPVEVSAVHAQDLDEAFLEHRHAGMPDGTTYTSMNELAGLSRLNENGEQAFSEIAPIPKLVCAGWFVFAVVWTLVLTS